MKRSLFLILPVIISLSACKKKKIEQAPCAPVYYESNSNDTILPSPYIMAYPGSVWNYDDGTTKTCDSWGQVGLVVASSLNSCTTFNTTWTTVPHTSFGYIHGVNQLTFPSGQSTRYMPLLATTPGLFYDYGGPVGSGNSAGTESDEKEVTELLDSMTVAGVTYYDVIHVHEHYSAYYPHMMSGPDYTTENYYAYGVGLIRSDNSNGLYGPPIRNLVSYTIGPH